MKFRQIELEKNLAKLFVDLDIDLQDLPIESQRRLLTTQIQPDLIDEGLHDLQYSIRVRGHSSQVSALAVLLHENDDLTVRKIVLHGGPGQGKSTITQMAVQIYRQQILSEDEIDPEGRWSPPTKARLPFRIELRRLADWLNGNPGSSIEAYLAMVIGEDSGGNAITVDDIQTAVENSPVLLIFDGLDEIGSDKLRDDVLKTIMDCINRFEVDLRTDLRVILTTRPPALAGRSQIFSDFERLSLAPMEMPRIDEYITRWLSVQIQEDSERARIRESYERRQGEPHVQALARNPMQLSVLLQFIRLKGEAFPDRRAELYRDYFQIVIDRDVEKSSELRENRQVIQALHEFIGYEIHALTEINEADRTLDRARLIDMAKDWLIRRGDKQEMAQRFFKLGEERFGLIVASRGEGEETRYGYEIQPIQEYFAAAYISNQMIESAHEIFEKMIRRAYWREVALFLAGLRRPNEKADLIARAKSVDQEKQLGWRHDGRAIILQLLQEGVFSEPPYVYSQALDFLFDLLDAKKLKVQREPSNFMVAMDTLLERQFSEQHKERLLGFLKEYSTCKDRHVVMRLYRVACHLLRPAEYLIAALSYRGDSPDLLATIRLGLPYNQGLDVEAMSKESSFWKGVSERIWGATWWREANRRSAAIDLSAPTRVHHYLIEEFATGGLRTGFLSPRRQPFMNVTSKLAIWKMIQKQQVLQFIGIMNEPNTHIRAMVEKALPCFCEDDDNVDYTGLDESVSVIVKDVLAFSHSLIEAFCSDVKKRQTVALEQYVERVRLYMQDAGLIGWVACQCGISLIRGTILRGMEYGVSRRSIAIAEDKSLLALADDIAPFFTTTTKDSPILTKHSDMLRYFNPHYSPWTRFNPYFNGPTLKAIRLEQDGRCVPLVDIFADSIKNDAELPFDWMETMPFDGEIIRSLIEKCRDALPATLEVVGQHRYAATSGRLLRVQDVQRVLKVGRLTDHPVTLAGVATVLMNANFLKIAETELVLKILRLDATSRLATILFSRRYKTDQGQLDPASLTKEIELIGRIAQEIIVSPEEYPFRIVSSAADFVAESTPVKLPPLSRPVNGGGIS